MIRRTLAVLVAVLVVLGGVGCGANPTKDAEKHRDMPKPADKDG